MILRRVTEHVKEQNWFAARQLSMIEWQRRTETGEPRLELFGPNMWSPLPGLITGMILTTEGGPIYLSGLGNALVKLRKTE